MAKGLIERYREHLPLEDGDPVVTLNEGSTPLVEAPVISERVGARVFLKLEGANPTGSFKDRGMTVAVSRAAGRGAEAVICASTGNTAASAAAYAAQGRDAGRGHRPGRKDRDRQARAGPDARRARDRDPRQLRRRADTCPRARAEAPDRARELGQPVPDRGPEDRGVSKSSRSSARLPAPSLSRSATRATSQRGGAVSASVKRRRGSTASRPRALRLSSAASRSRTPRRSPPRSASATPPAGRRR